VVSFPYTRTRAFNDHEFFKDFIGALHQLERDRPDLEERPRWWLALAEADRKDVARYVAHLNAQDDHEYFARQHVTYVPVIHAAQDGHPQMTESPASSIRQLDAEGRLRVTKITKWEYQTARDYSGENYQKQKRERDWTDHWSHHC
jgi:hypothetical protein